MRVKINNFRASFRRNQLMLTVSATFVLLLSLAVWGVIAGQNRSEFENTRREESRQQIANVEKRIECLGQYFQYVNRHQLVIRSYIPCEIDRLKPGEKPPSLPEPENPAEAQNQENSGGEQNTQPLSNAQPTQNNNPNSSTPPQNDNSGGNNNPQPPQEPESTPLLLPPSQGIIRDSVPVLGIL